jgi:hypothetical protein
MADTEILQFQLDDGSIAEFEVPKEAQPTMPQAEFERAPFGTRFKAALQEEGAKLGGALLGATSAVSPIGDYTLDILAGALPGVESKQLRDLTKQYREENPYLSTATDIVGGFAPGGLYKTLSKAPSFIGDVATAATKSPAITNLVESFVQGSARPYAEKPGQEPGLTGRAVSGAISAGTTGALMGGANLLGSAGRWLGSKVLPSMKQAPTELSPDEQTVVRLLGMEDVANLTPEMIQQALASQQRAAAAGQGGMETLAESLGTTTRGIAGAYAQGPGGREVATQALEGRTSPGTLRQQMGMIIEPLGKPESFLPSQREGYEALEETLQKGQQALSAQGKQIYQGAFKEEMPYRVINEYGQLETPRQFGVYQPYRQEALPPKVEFSPEITRASEDPTYKSLASNYIATTYPKGEMAPDIRSQEVANQVASQLKQALKNPRRYLEETQIKIADIPGRKLLKTLEDELLARNPDLPQRRLAYKEAAPQAKGVSADVEQQIQNILSGGPLGRPGERLMSYEVDPDSFKMIVNAVQKQGGQSDVDKIKRSVAGAIKRAYSQSQGQELINTPFEKGDERFQKMVALVGEEKAVNMLDKVNRLTNFVKFKNQILGGSPTQPRQEMARQLSEANKNLVAEEIGSFLSMAAGNTSRSGWIIKTAKRLIGTPDKPLSEREVAKYLFSQGDSATKKLKATELFLKDLQRTDKGKEEFNRLFNSYLSRQLQQSLANAGLGEFYKED